MTENSVPVAPFPHLPHIEVQYFRDYGIHTVEDEAGAIHIFSFPNWEELRTALITELPEEGTVLTTECATFTEPHEQLPGNEQLIEERGEFVREVSSQTRADIWLGTFGTPRTEGAWSNRMLCLNGGKVVASVQKELLSGYEEAHSPVQAAPLGTERTVKNGRGILICSEVAGAGSMRFDAPAEINTLLVPACWAAVPERLSRLRAEWIQDMGGEDNYFRRALERGAGLAFKDTGATTLVVADRNVIGTAVNGPFNAAYRVLDGR